MVGPHKPFPISIQNDALKRQRGKCGSCGSPIFSVGTSGASAHKFGEGAEGHHVIPHQMGGPLTLENCVVLCKSCHYSVHRGGHWKYTEQYNFVKGLPMAQRIAAVAKLYPHYR
jgi:5-methylcytosine-specific restriction endonuclease McrA